jgi:hypothetical protein
VAGWRNLLDDFRVLEAQDFSRDEVHRFIYGWHRAIITQAERARLELDIPDADERERVWRDRRFGEVQNAIDLHSRRLANAVNTSQRILGIARNPMLLSLICLVHYSRFVLPRERALLYSQCIELLIDAWDRSRDIMSTLHGEISSSQKEAVLRHIALEFQRSGKGEAPREAIEALVGSVAESLGIEAESRELVDDIERRSGLLVQRSLGVFGFSHLTLQEYLTAKHIQLNPQHLDLLESSFDNQEWREVVLLYAGLVDDATAFIDHVLQSDTASRWVLAGYALGEARHCDDAVGLRIVHRLLDELDSHAESPDTLVEALSAIAIDFTGEARTPEQKLTESLLERVASRHQTTRHAIAILGRARITRVVPALVSLLDSQETELGPAAAEALVMFGNLAVDDVLKAARHGQGLVPLTPFVDTLVAIDTAQAAKALISFYDVWQKPPEHQYISFALASMLRNQFVFSELAEMTSAELSRGLSGGANDRSGWDFGPTVSVAFRGLDRKIRNDLKARLADGALGSSGDAWATVDFRVLFPMTVQYLKTSEVSPPSEVYRTLGFDTDSVPSATLANLHGEVRRADADLHTSLERMSAGIRTTRTTDPVGERPGASVLTWAAEVVLAAFFLGTVGVVLLVLFFVVREFRQGGTFDRPADITVVVSAFSILFASIAAIVFAKVQSGCRVLSLRMLACLVSPLRVILRRTPYLTRLRPWNNFLLFNVFFSTFSVFTGLVAMGLAETGDWVQVARMMTIGDSAGIVVTVSQAVFWVTGVAYYRSVVLGTDAVGYLLSLHPEGRRILGLSRY